MKVAITIEGLRNLAKAAEQNGTLQHFVPIAIEFAEQSEKEIGRLNDEIARMLR